MPERYLDAAMTIRMIGLVLAALLFAAAAEALAQDASEQDQLAALSRVTDPAMLDDFFLSDS